jgi:hypothetical protein
MQHRVSEAQLEPLVRAGARLLRVEARGPQAWTLWFDRGGIEIALAGRGLELGPAAALGGETHSLDEEEPWWAVLGAPLAGAWSSTDTEGRRIALELQLRRDDEGPKRIALEPRAGRMHARVI